MKLTQADIKGLYGDVFFLVGEGHETLPKKVHSPQIKEKPKEETGKVSEAAAKTAQSPPPKLESEPFEQYIGLGPMTNWKLKARSEIALIVLASEFSDKNAMANLKNLVVGAGIDTSMIGFGIIEDGRTGWNFSDMPVSKGIVFASFPERLPSPVVWKGKELYAAAPMKLIMEDERYATAMDRLLQKVKESL